MGSEDMMWHRAKSYIAEQRDIATRLQAVLGLLCLTNNLFAGIPAASASVVSIGYGSTTIEMGDVVGTLTLGAVLNHLMDQVQQAIEGARNAGLSMEIEAGREATIAIQNAQNAYASSLNLTMDRVDQTTKNSIDQLKSLADGVSANTFQNLDDLTTRVQQAINALPFREHEPQLTKVTPRFVVPSIHVYPVRIRFQGNFEASAMPGYSPVLLVGTKKYSPVSTTGQELQFQIATNELFSTSSSSKFDFTNAQLQVPWKSCALKVIWCLRDKPEVDTYKVLIGALPGVPGSLTINWTTPRTQHNEKHYTSQPFYQSSGSDGANDDHKDVPYSVHAEDGWHIKRGTAGVAPTPGPNEGERSLTFIGDDGDVAVYRVTTIHKSWGTSGRYSFNIQFDEYQDVAATDKNTAKLDLKWGDSKSFNYGAGTWTLLYDSFDGSHSEFTGADISNPFIKIKNSGGAYIVGTADPSSLVWP